MTVLVGFQSGCHLFQVFTTLVRTSSTILDRRDEGGHASLVLGLRKVSLFIHHLNMICVV